MSCQSVTCKHQFCWICLGDWASHNGDNYRCNRYEEGKTTDKNTQSIHSLQRYLFYFERYYGHFKSLKSENELKAQMDQKIKDLTGAGDYSLLELQFLKQGSEILCQSRQTLMFTYVFAYYLARNNAATIFEDNQSDLQRATEELSGLLEKEIQTKDEFLQMKHKILNITKYCENRCEVLLKHVYEGYQKEGYWGYIEAEDPKAVVPKKR